MSAIGERFKPWSTQAGNLYHEARVAEQAGAPPEVTLEILRRAEYACLRIAVGLPSDYRTKKLAEVRAAIARLETLQRKAG